MNPNECPHCAASERSREALRVERDEWKEKAEGSEIAFQAAHRELDETQALLHEARTYRRDEFDLRMEREASLASLWEQIGELEQEMRNALRGSDESEKGGGGYWMRRAIYNTVKRWADRLASLRQQEHT